MTQLQRSVIINSVHAKFSFRPSNPAVRIADLIAGYCILDRAYERLSSFDAVREPGSILLARRAEVAAEMDSHTLSIAMAVADHLTPEYGE